MQFEDFIKTIKEIDPPAGINDCGLALWYDARADWEKAHILIQDMATPRAAWIHAYLHRKEGDAGNAAYWYSRAGKRMPDYPLAQEWEEIAKVIVSED